MDETEQKNKKNQLKESLINTSYKATHYMSYRSHRRSQKIARSFLGIAIVFALFGLIPWPIIQGAALNSALFLILIYILFDYWTTSKSTQMKKDSKTVVNQASMMAGVKTITEGWHVYDGGFETNGKETLEISFVKERSFLGNVYELRLKNKPLFLNSKDSIESLRYFLLKQRQNKGYTVYGTVDSKYAGYLQENGIVLEELPKKFISKPNRFDYAAATGKFSNALKGYPKDFKAYIFTVDLDQENQRIKEKAVQDKIVKDDNRSLINLKKLK